MEYNKDKVRKIVSEIMVSLRLLDELKQLPKESFLTDRHKTGSAKYSLIVAIEEILDLSNHIIAKNGFRAPDDYADTFKVLEENKIIKSDFSHSLIMMTRFRNRLVHIYWEIDTSELFNIIQSDLEDIRQFLKKIGKFIEIQ